MAQLTRDIHSILRSADTVNNLPHQDINQLQVEQLQSIKRTASLLKVIICRQEGRVKWLLNNYTLKNLRNREAEQEIKLNLLRISLLKRNHLSMTTKLR